MKYGKLTVNEFFFEDGIKKAKCLCECGNVKTVRVCHLKSGATKSCGCFRNQRIRETLSTHGGKGTSLYNRWKSIKQRCENKGNSRYKDYGARGITICEEWKEFNAFKEWSYKNGYSEKLVLDRIDNDKGYSPDNCRWCDVKTNNDNRRTTVKVEGKTLKSISEEYDISYSKLKSFYYRKKPKTINEILIYANQLPTS